ncbi:MAG TPA: hypothetical protein VFE10_05845 [Phenylobacterium sp.]|nr:hypothetical protein [Phenylobacterium sp.]
MRTALPLAVGISALALLSACDNGPSAVSKKASGPEVASASAPEQSYGSGRSNSYDDPAPKVDHRKDEVAKTDDGKPMWAASKDGAPRTLFKPDDGMAYWQKRKDRDEHSQASARRSKYADDNAE